VIQVPRNEVNMQKLLSIYHPQVDELWEEVNIAKEAADEIEILEQEMEALNLVQQLDIEHLEEVMRTELGS
mgnify:CR=1